MLDVYNKAEADFADLKSYNDYLETVEDIIFEIVNDGPSAKQFMKDLKELQLRDAGGIAERQSRRVEEERRQKEMLDDEKNETEERHKERREEEISEKILKSKLKKEKIDVSLGDRDKISQDLQQKLTQAKIVGYTVSGFLLRLGLLRSSTATVPPFIDCYGARACMAALECVFSSFFSSFLFSSTNNGT